MKKIKLDYHLFWNILPFIGLLIWGTLCLSNNLWYDEAYSASMVSRSWFDLIRITAVDDHSPFYYMILKLFFYLGGQFAYFQSLKLLSLLFMIGYLLLGKFYVKKLFGEKISVYFMFFSVTMPIMLVQAGNVRMYATALFFFTLTSLSAYDIYLDATKRKWQTFCLASICSVYCHTFTLIMTFYLYLFLLGILLYKKRSEEIKNFFRAGFTVALVFSPWLLVTIRQMLLRMKNDPGVMPTGANDIYDILKSYIQEWFSALETPITLVIYLGLVAALLLSFFTIKWMRANHNYVPIIALGIPAITALTGALISIFLNPCFLGRYIFPGFGLVALWLSIGMSHVSARSIKALLFVLTLSGFFLQYRSELSLEYDAGLSVYQNFWEENVSEGDCIIASQTHTVFLNVYHPNTQYFIYGYKLYSLPFVNTDAYTSWNQLENREGNIWFICFKGDTPDKMSERYTYEEALSFHYMYYDFVIYKLSPITM